jgi:hypothetical protein
VRERISEARGAHRGFGSFQNPQTKEKPPGSYAAGELLLFPGIVVSC